MSLGVETLSVPCSRQGHRFSLFSKMKGTAAVSSTELPVFLPRISRVKLGPLDGATYEKANTYKMSLNLKSLNDKKLNFKRLCKIKLFNFTKTTCNGIHAVRNIYKLHLY